MLPMAKRLHSEKEKMYKKRHLQWIGVLSIQPSLQEIYDSVIGHNWHNNLPVLSKSRVSLKSTTKALPRCKNENVDCKSLDLWAQSRALCLSQSLCSQEYASIFASAFADANAESINSCSWEDSALGDDASCSTNTDSNYTPEDNLSYDYCMEEESKQQRNTRTMTAILPEQKCGEVMEKYGITQDSCYYLQVHGEKNRCFLLGQVLYGSQMR